MKKVARRLQSVSWRCLIKASDQKFVSLIAVHRSLRPAGKPEVRFAMRLRMSGSRPAQRSQGVFGDHARLGGADFNRIDQLGSRDRTSTSRPSFLTRVIGPMD